MGMVLDGSIFVAVCLAAGVGVFVAFEGVRNLQAGRVAAGATGLVEVMAGVLVSAAAGGYWLSMAMP